MSRNRKHAMRYDQIYEDIELLNKEDRYNCYYCGVPASAIDHQPPISKIENLINTGEIFEAVKVPVCNECNSLLSDATTKTLAERFELLKQKLRKKYKKHLQSNATWNQEEINELGYNLKSMVLASMRLGLEAEERILYKGSQVKVKETYIDSDFVRYCDPCNTYHIQEKCPYCGKKNPTRKE